MLGVHYSLSKKDELRSKLKFSLIISICPNKNVFSLLFGALCFAVCANILLSLQVILIAPSFIANTHPWIIGLSSKQSDWAVSNYGALYQSWTNNEL